MGLISAEFKSAGVKKKDFKINTEEIVMASVFKPSKGSFFKGLGNSELQIHLVPDQSCSNSCPKLKQEHLLEVIFSTKSFHFQILEEGGLEYLYHQLGVQ